jgi:YVTN family beta-propeller protein
MNCLLFKLTAFALLLTSLAACNFHTEADMDDMDDMETVELNIDYPAAYVVNGGSHTIQVLNLNNLGQQEQFSLNGATFPHHIYLSPDKARLAVAITSTDLSGGHDMGGTSAILGYKVIILNSYTGKIEKEIGLPKMPYNAVFNPNGSELWIAQEDAHQSVVLVYNTGNWSLKNTITVGKGLSEVTFSADGTKVFSANTLDATVSIIDPATKTVLSTVAVGKNPVGAWPATNGYMYVNNQTDSTVTEIAVATGTVTETIKLSFKPSNVAYHPAQQELWVNDATNGKIVYYQKTNNRWVRQGSITTGADAYAIAFSQDDTTAYVTNQGANTVSVIKVADHSLTATIPVGHKPNGLVLRQ